LTQDPEIDSDAQGSGLLTLVIGDQTTWKAEFSALPEIDGFRFIDIADLTGKVFEDFPATIVLSTLFAGNLDAIEIARKLSDLTFRGRYRVVADGLPKPDLIIREVAAVAPDIDFEILNLPTQS